MRLKLPADISTAEGISHALAAILASAAQGEITIGEAVQLASLLEVRRKMIETQTALARQWTTGFTGTKTNEK